MITPPERLLFATDFSGRCDRPLERSVRLARLWGAKLLLLHVLEPHRRELTDFERTEEEARITAEVAAEASRLAKVRTARDALERSGAVTPAPGATAAPVTSSTVVPVSPPPSVPSPPPVMAPGGAPSSAPVTGPAPAVVPPTR